MDGGRKREGIRSEYSGLVPAVDQASRILILLAQSPSQKVNLTEICKGVGIHKSKGYSILNTLQRYGLVQKDPVGKTYFLGLGLISLSRRVLDNLNFSEAARPFLEALAGKTHSTAFFGLINGSNVFVVAKQEADQRIGVTTRVGHRFNLTHGAHGKAIVAFLSQPDRERILGQQKLFFHGSASKFDRQRLEAELAQCRESGFAIDMGDLNAGINVIASPLFDSQGSPLGSVFIMGTFSESYIREYGAIVAETARRFSAMFGATTDRVCGKTET